MMPHVVLHELEHELKLESLPAGLVVADEHVWRRELKCSRFLARQLRAPHAAEVTDGARVAREKKRASVAPTARPDGPPRAPQEVQQAACRGARLAACRTGASRASCGGATVFPPGTTRTVIFTSQPISTRFAASTGLPATWNSRRMRTCSIPASRADS